MSEAKRQTRSAKFKAKLGLKAVRGVKTVKHIAQVHGVHPAPVSQWKKQISESTETLFAGNRGPKVVDGTADQEWLYSGIGRLKMELDRLKENSGISL